MVLVKDVAKKAGVGISTVSRAMRSRSDVSTKTKQKILEIAKGMGYRPNVSASSLVMKKTNTVGVAINDLGFLAAPYMSSISSGIAEVCDSNGFRIVFTRCALISEDTESEFLKHAQEGLFDGAIIIHQLVSKSDVKAVHALNIPLIAVDTRLSSINIPSVRVNYSKAVKEATGYLCELGHKRIALITYSKELYDFKQKNQGFREALNKYSITYDENLVKFMSKGEECKTNVNALHWLKRQVEKLENLQNRPTAYVCMQDTKTLLLRDVLQSRGLRIPEDVSLIGVSSLESEFSGCYVGHIEVPGHEIGKRSCQLLMDMIENRTFTSDIVLEATFNPRMSCIPPQR